MLREAGASADWPPTPDLAAPIAPARIWRMPARRALALALAGLLLAAASAAAVPGVRDSVLEWLGLRSVRIERVPRPLPEPAGAPLALGRHTTLADARARLGFVPLLASGLGKPTIYYEGFPPGGQLGLVYRDGKLFLTEVQGSIRREYLFKLLPPGTKVEPLQVGPGRGLWIQGRHQFAYADRSGHMRTDSVRTAGPVLLWRHGRLLLRLEGAGTKAEALRIARSLRAAP